jgi:hypothetical protein
MRTDAQIASLLLAFTLPIHRYEWCIDPLLGVLFVGMGAYIEHCGLCHIYDWCVRADSPRIRQDDRLVLLWT